MGFLQILIFQIAGAASVQDKSAEIPSHAHCSSQQSILYISHVHETQRRRLRPLAPLPLSKRFRNQRALSDPDYGALRPPNSRIDTLGAKGGSVWTLKWSLLK